MTEPDIEIRVAEEKRKKEREKDKKEGHILATLSRNGFLPPDINQWERKGLIFRFGTPSSKEEFKVALELGNYILTRIREEKMVKEGNRASWRMAKAVCQEDSLKPISFQLTESERQYSGLGPVDETLPKREEATNIYASASGGIEVIVSFPYNEGLGVVEVVKKEGKQPEITLNDVLQGDPEGESVAQREVDERLGKLLGAEVNMESDSGTIKELLRQRVVEELSRPARSGVIEKAV